MQKAKNIELKAVDFRFCRMTIDAKISHSRESETAQKVQNICLNRHSERSEESIYCRSIEILRNAWND